MALNDAEAYNVIQGGAPVYGLVDRGGYLCVFCLDSAEQFEKFHLWPSCRGWRPRPKLGFCLSAEDAEDLVDYIEKD